MYPQKRIRKRKYPLKRMFFREPICLLIMDGESPLNTTSRGTAIRAQFLAVKLSNQQLAFLIRSSNVKRGHGGEMKVEDFLKVLGAMAAQEKISLLAEARTLSGAGAAKAQHPSSQDLPS